MRLKDKVAIITGAGSGMGRAGAVLFAREGAKVVVADIDPKGGEETVSLVKAAGGEAIFVRTDISNLEDIQKMVNAAVEKYGKLNILWNHAGIPTPGGGFDAIDAATWEKCINLNVRSGFFATKFAIPEMKKAGGGSILYTASVAGHRGHTQAPLYSMTKAAVMNLARTTAKQMAKFNIRSNSISPGPIDTPMLPEFSGRAMDPEAYRKAIMAAVPLGRLGQPQEIAQAALFLASDEASYITGIDMLVDGGTLS